VSRALNCQTTSTDALVSIGPATVFVVDRLIHLPRIDVPSGGELPVSSQVAWAAWPQNR